MEGGRGGREEGKRLKMGPGREMDGGEGGEAG